MATCILTAPHHQEHRQGRHKRTSSGALSRKSSRTWSMTLPKGISASTAEKTVKDTCQERGQEHHQGPLARASSRGVKLIKPCDSNPLKHDLGEIVANVLAQPRPNPISVQSSRHTSSQAWLLPSFQGTWPSGDCVRLASTVTCLPPLTLPCLFVCLQTNMFICATMASE